jgi:hypothetical protein
MLPDSSQSGLSVHKDREVVWAVVVQQCDLTGETTLAVIKTGEWICEIQIRAHGHTIGINPNHVLQHVIAVVAEFPAFLLQEVSSPP